MDLLILLVIIGLVIAFVVSRSQRREKAARARGAAVGEEGRRGGRHPVRRGRHAARQRHDRPPARRGDPAGLPAGPRLLRRGQGGAGPGAAPGRHPRHHRHPRGRPLRGGLRAGPAGRQAGARPAATVLLQPPARPLQRERRLGTPRRRAALGPGLPGGRRAGPRGRRAGRPQGAGRRRPGAVLAGRPRLQPLRPGLLLPVRDVRAAARPVPRLAALRRLRRRGRLVLRRLPGRSGRLRRRRRW